MGGLQPLNFLLQERDGQGAAELSQTPQVWPELDFCFKSAHCPAQQPQ